MRVFAFIEAEKADFSIEFICEQLGVTRQGFYAWRKRPPCQRRIEDAAYTAVIKRSHTESRCTYESPRIHAELADDYNTRCGRKRVARLMRTARIQGCHRRNKTWTTRRNPSAAPAPARVERDFTARAPNQLWVADITYVPTWAGFGYLATALDVYSRRIVGWAFADHIRTELIIDAVNTDVFTRRPLPGVIHHSDQGTQTVHGTRMRGLCRQHRTRSIRRTTPTNGSLRISRRCQPKRVSFISVAILYVT